MKIDYNTIVHYYFNIIISITKHICTIEDVNEYEKEYIHADSYLEKASWRLNDLEKMEDYYDNPDFIYFGLHNLRDTRFRIEDYLGVTDLQFPDCVYDYKKYDDIVIDYFDEENESILKYEDSFEKYYTLRRKISTINNIQTLFKSIPQQIDRFNKLIDDGKDINKGDLRELYDVTKDFYRRLTVLLLDYNYK